VRGRAAGSGKQEIQGYRRASEHEGSKTTKLTFAGARLGGDCPHFDETIDFMNLQELR